jgi:hypothetical protein
MKLHKDLLINCILLIVATLVYLPFVYGGVLGEWDSYRMAIGTIDSLTTNRLFASPLLYNLSISYGYFGLLYLFTPLFKVNTALVISVMNYLNVASAILMVIPFFWLVKHYWGIVTAIAANLLLMFVPSWWNVSLYGHPMGPAVLLMFTGLALLAYRSHLSASSKPSVQWIGLDILIIAAFSMSLTFRLDAALLFPLIPACLWLEGYSFKEISLRSALYGLLSLLVFFAGQFFVPGIVPTSSLLERFWDWHNVSRVIPNLVRGVVIGVLACHPLYLMTFGLACLLLVYQHKFQVLFFILPAFILNFLFWLPNPSPARHFVYIAPVLAVGIALGFCLNPLKRLGKGLSPLPLVLLFIIASFITSELMYPVVRAYYPWKAAPQNYSARAYIRSIFINKYLAEQYFHQANRFGLTLSQLEAKPEPMVVLADMWPVLLQMQLQSNQLQLEVKTVDNLSERLDVYIVHNGKNEFILLDSINLNRNDLDSVLKQVGPYQAYAIAEN